jgi:hypothetical protein
MDKKIIIDTRNFLNHEEWVQAGFDVKILGKDKLSD